MDDRERARLRVLDVSLTILVVGLGVAILGSFIGGTWGFVPVAVGSVTIGAGAIYSRRAITGVPASGGRRPAAWPQLVFGILLIAGGIALLLYKLAR